MLQNIENDDNNPLQHIYIRALGVIGDRKALYPVIKIYIRHQKDKWSVISHVSLKSLGLFGDKDAIPILEKILENNHQPNWAATVASSLYLLTGKKYNYVDSLGNKQEFISIPEIDRAREVILASRGRKRTLPEMVILDKTFRPPQEDRRR